MLPRSIQRNLQLVKRYGHEFVQHDAPRGQLGLAVWRHQLADQIWPHGKLCRDVTRTLARLVIANWGSITFAGEVEEQREFLPVWHPGTLLPELVEEWVDHRLHSAQTRARRVFQKLGHQIDSLGCCAWPENLCITVLCKTRLVLLHRCGNLLSRRDGA